MRWCTTTEFNRNIEEVHPMSFESTVLEFSASKIEELHAQIDSSVAKLTPQQVWLRGG